MARTDYKIFKKLKEQSVTPPPEMWDELRLRLFENDSTEQFKQLKEYELEPKEDAFNDILSRKEDEKLITVASQLQQYELVPPAELGEAVIKANIKRNKPGKGWLYQPKKIYRLLAAAAIAAFIITTVTVIINKRRIADDSFADTKKRERGGVENSSSGKTGAVESMHKKQALGKDHFFKQHFLSVYSMNIEGFVIPVSDNDLLLSFTEYMPVGKHISLNENTGSGINIGSSTNIAISKYMIDVINDLYQVKRNGKPTWKAKRTKAKILRWRKEDARLFSKKKKNNPLDLIDLADNVY
jgi:hypothetical protein